MAGISMKELSEILGVSTASISVALRGKPGISPETRQRILEEAKARGYDMSRLSSPETKGTIVIMDYTYYALNMPEDGKTFSFYSQFVEAATQAILQHGYSPQGPFPPSVLENQKFSEPDGYILIGGNITDEQLAVYQQKSIPFVVTGNSMEHLPVTTVFHDNRYGIHEAMTHLRKQGHTQIGFVSLLQSCAGAERRQAYILETLDSDCEADIIDIRTDQRFSHTAIQKAQDWLTQHPPKSTAYVCDNDVAAAALMRALRSRQIVPGRDIAVIGFDDQPIAALMEPPLTTVRIYEAEMATESVHQLIYSMQHPDFNFRHVKIGTKLITRDSTPSRVTSCE